MISMQGVTTIIALSINWVKLSLILGVLVFLSAILVHRYDMSLQTENAIRLLNHYKSMNIAESDKRLTFVWDLNSCFLMEAREDGAYAYMGTKRIALIEWISQSTDIKKNLQVNCPLIYYFTRGIITPLWLALVIFLIQGLVVARTMRGVQNTGSRVLLPMIHATIALSCSVFALTIAALSGFAGSHLYDLLFLPIGIAAVLPSLLSLILLFKNDKTNIRPSARKRFLYGLMILLEICTLILFALFIGDKLI